MPAFQATPIFSSPSTKKRHSSPLLNKVKSDGIAKKTRKPALSPQRPPVTRPDRNPRRHIPKHGFKPFCLVKCMRIKGNLMQSLLEAMAEPEQMEEVVYQHDKTCPCALCCGPRPMDTVSIYTPLHLPELSSHLLLVPSAC